MARIRAILQSNAQAYSSLYTGEPSVVLVMDHNQNNGDLLGQIACWQNVKQVLSINMGGEGKYVLEQLLPEKLSNFLLIEAEKGSCPFFLITGRRDISLVLGTTENNILHIWEKFNQSHTAT